MKSCKGSNRVIWKWPNENALAWKTMPAWRGDLRVYSSFLAPILNSPVPNHMNLFVTDDCPYQSAYNLPDKLVVKMALENAQMLAANFSEEFLGYGGLKKKDGTFYKATHKNHPCTKWGRESKENVAWMIVHGLAICAEYHRRYGKIHSCLQAHLDAKRLFEANGGSLQLYKQHSPFVRAMPEVFKLDPEIDSVEAYRRYMHTKPYAAWKFCNSPAWWNNEQHSRVSTSLQSQRGVRVP